MGKKVELTEEERLSSLIREGHEVIRDLNTSLVSAKSIMNDNFAEVREGYENSMEAYRAINIETLKEMYEEILTEYRRLFDIIVSRIPKDNLAISEIVLTRIPEETEASKTRMNKKLDGFAVWNDSPDSDI